MTLRKDGEYSLKTLTVIISGLIALIPLSASAWGGVNL